MGHSGLMKCCIMTQLLAICLPQGGMLPLILAKIGATFNTSELSLIMEERDIQLKPFGGVAGIRYIACF